ncbi:MAG: TRAP transporter large permease [Alphaproteobacteria bacterium]|nr:TRAP transporter large permease [Alphaproteobacteria bacterium]
MAALGIVFTVLLLLGTPIAVSLGMAGVAGILSENLRTLTAPQRMFTSLDSFVLLAAPFYIFAGEVMYRGGITERLIRFSNFLVGRVRGGTAYAAIIAAILFSGISGTAVADAAALGQVYIRGMPREGYRKEFAAALIAAAAMIGPIIPPSVIMVIYAGFAGVSVVKMFLAGIIPGLLMGLSLAVVVFVYGLRGSLPESRPVVAREEIPRVLGDGLVVMSLPAFILGGSVSGIFTPTEAGGIACIYALFLGIVWYRDLRWAGIWAALKTSSRMSAILFFVVSTVAICDYTLTVGGIANYTKLLFEPFAGQPILFLTVVAVAMLVLGTFLDPGPMVILFIPLLMPIVRSMGIDEYQFSMIFILTGTLGLVTPPVGIVLFVSCKIGNIDQWTLFKAVIPFIAAEFVVVLLMVLFPGISNWLPSLV